MNAAFRSPVIIIGMHRFGTTMVAEILEQCGLFSGVKKDPNHESLFFQEKNDWIMHECGATWDHPEPMHYLADNKELRTLIKDYLLRSMKAPAAIRYLGWKKYMQHLLVSLRDSYIQFVTDAHKFSLCAENQHEPKVSGYRELIGLHTQHDLMTHHFAFSTCHRDGSPR